MKQSEVTKLAKQYWPEGFDNIKMGLRYEIVDTGDPDAMWCNDWGYFIFRDRVPIDHGSGFRKMGQAIDFAKEQIKAIRNKNG